MKCKNVLWTLLLFFLLIARGESQEIWSLQRAVEYAQENNLSVQQTRAQVRTTALAERTAKAARLPNLGAQVNAGQQFGRTVDPTTNQFSNETVTFASMSLTANLTLFNGGLVHHSVRQAKYDMAAAEADAEQAADNIGLQVAQAYLNILLSEEQAVIARQRLEQSRRQLEQTEKLIQAGSLPQADRFNLLAQIARDEQSVIVAQNSIEIAYLTLKQLLQLEPDAEMQVEKPKVTIPDDAVTVETFTLPNVYEIAQSTQPALKAAEYRRQSAEEGIAIAKADYWPSLSVFANLNDNYSSAFPDFANAELGGLVPGPVQLTLINGTTVPVQFLSPEVRNVPTLPFWNQLDQNFGQNIGIGVNIPIYQNNRIRLSVERARLNLVNTELQNNQVRQQLKNDIQTALANVRAGRLAYEAAQRTLESTQTAYDNTFRRQELGAATTLELTTARTNLDVAQNDLLVSRYEYLFRLKILDFYLGKPLTLK